eukprot:g5302.t1
MAESADSLRSLLEQFQRGDLDVSAATSRIRELAHSPTAPTVDAHVDLDRHRRCGFPEVVYCEGKTSEAVVGVFEALYEHGEDCFGTRVAAEQAEAVLKRFPAAVHNTLGRTIRVTQPGTSETSPGRRGSVCVVTAGTSDRPVAEETLETLRWMGCDVELVVDVGVAGPHRLPEHLDRIRAADAVVVIAGMEGALPSVVGGWVDCPVVAVPTSVGYGASFGGVTALLGMLNSCASNVTVVNIDAGFKGGYIAGLIARKGSFGRVTIVAGSRGMSGAAALAGLGALRGGAGLVYLAVPESILPSVAGVEPSFLTIPLPDDDQGRISGDGLAAFQQTLSQQSAVAIGPGMGQTDGTKQTVRDLYESLVAPMVIDADGLNVLADSIGELKPAGPRILTPHPGEFARLTGSDIETVESQREELAAQFASEHQVILVLKGRNSVVTDGERVAINTTGNAGMATGGSGDVLTGLIAALLGQELPPFDAAHLGVHLHGSAGDLAAAELSQPGMIASDLPRFLPAAWKLMLGD